MRRAYFEVDKPRIEIIPMIDIMMFLLVFFIMITLTMIAGAGIPLELPQAKTAEQLTPTKVTIGVQIDGSMFLEGKPVSAEDLDARLREEQRSGKKLDVVIAGEKRVPLQILLNVMDVVRRAGISAVGIATRPDADNG